MMRRDYYGHDCQEIPVVFVGRTRGVGVTSFFTRFCLTGRVLSLTRAWRRPRARDATVARRGCGLA